MSWPNEKKRHSLASKGIKTTHEKKIINRTKKVVQIKFSRQAIPMEVIVSSKKEENTVKQWAYTHPMIRWTRTEKDALYGDEISYKEFQKEYLKEAKP